MFFNNNLPSKRTLQMWYTVVDGSPGISESAIDIIRDKAASYEVENGHKLHLTIISDEMAIRRQIVWNIETQSFIGFSTVINSSQQTNIPNTNNNDAMPKVGKEALVFLVVGPDFKIPIAYHLLNGLETVDRAALTLDAIKRIEEAGAVIMSITSDGLYANRTVAEMLGANFEDGMPFFYSGTNPDQRIVIVFDPCHMLKLVRKYFSSECLYFENDLIDWSFLRLLVEKQNCENFKLCNKLTRHHIQWQTKPMNVKLAAQTLSKSVADLLEQLSNDGYEQFKNTARTVEFIRYYDNVFDILNFADKNQTNDDFKKPISETTAEGIFSYLESFKEYVNKLSFATMNKKNETIKTPILKSRAFMGFFGFYVDAISLKGMYEDFVLNGPLEVLYTMQFSQDHLETFFSLIRNSLGRNDNPNAMDFRSAFRKLLVCHPLMTSLDQNVISNATGILTISSRKKKESLAVPVPVQSVADLDVNYQEIMASAYSEMDKYDEHMCAYIAQLIENKIEKNTSKARCEDCISMLEDRNDMIQDELLAKKNVKQPCESTVKIVVFSNAIIKIVSSNSSEHFDTILRTILINMDIDDV